MNWVWIGFGVLALGTLIALLPETAFAFAVSKVPANAATASMLLLVVLAQAVPVRAQHDVSQVRTVQRSARREAHHSASSPCWCGGCPKLPGRASASVATARAVRAEVDAAHEGRHVRGQILDHFVKQQAATQVLTEPPDTASTGSRGSCRTRWRAPLLGDRADRAPLGASARRSPAAPRHALDPTLDARLDDELRNLD